MVFGAYEHFICLDPDVWITTLVLVAVPYCVPRGMCEYLLRLMELNFASLSLQKGLELHGHHWQADAVLAVFPQVGNERKPAEERRCAIRGCARASRSRHGLLTSPGCAIINMPCQNRASGACNS